jgi:hypothetical protein
MLNRSAGYRSPYCDDTNDIPSVVDADSKLPTSWRRMMPMMKLDKLAGFFV